MASLRKRGKFWYYRIVDASGMQHECKGCPDRRVTEQMAAAAELDAEADAAFFANYAPDPSDAAD